MGKADIVFASIIIAISVLMYSLSLSFPDPQTSGLSPRVFPQFVAVSMGALAMILLYQGVTKLRKAREKAGKERGERTVTIERAFVIRFTGLVVAGLAYILLITTAGYVIATVLLVAAAMVLFGEVKWYRITAVSVLTSVVLYLLFRTVFRVPLPRFPL